MITAGESFPDSLPVPATGLGWCVLILCGFFTCGGLWSVIQIITQWVLNRPSRKGEIARVYAEKDRIKTGTHIDREKWIQDVADKHFDRLDKRFDEYQLWARGLRRASENAIDVFEPLVLRFRPTDDEDSVVATVYVAEYLGAKTAIHDVREHLQ